MDFDPWPYLLDLGEGSPTKVDYRKKVPLILTSLLEDLDLHILESLQFFSPKASGGQPLRGEGAVGDPSHPPRARAAAGAEAVLHEPKPKGQDA